MSFGVGVKGLRLVNGLYGLSANCCQLLALACLHWRCLDGRAVVQGGSWRVHPAMCVLAVHCCLHTCNSPLSHINNPPPQGRAFMVQPLLGRTAYASLHFLELLVGPRCQQLDVDKPEVRVSVEV